MSMRFKDALRQSIDNHRFVVKDKDHVTIAYLEMVDANDLDNQEFIGKVTAWRKRYAHCFLSVFETTEERTRRWLRDTLLKDPNRALFKIMTPDERFVGHIGAICHPSHVEYDYYIKGEKVDVPDFAITVAKRFLFWVCEVTAMDTILGRVRSDNVAAVDFHMRTGFKINRRFPLRIDRVSDTEYCCIVDASIRNPQLYLLEILMYKHDIDGP